MRRCFTCAVVLIALLAAGDPALAARAPGASPSSAFSSWLPTRFRQKLASATSGASEVPPAPEASDARPKPDDSPRLDRRVLAETPLNPWLQPTTFLRVALLILRNAALDNPAAGFLQSILTTELAYTAFTNVFASFAAASVQDFSSSLSNQGAVASEWVVDGETNLNNVLASEFVYGGAWGFEQFYGFGFEISGDAAAAIQQSLQPTWIPNEGEPRAANATNEATNDATKKRRRLLSPDPALDETLSDEDAKRRNLPPGAKLLARVRKPLDGAKTRAAVAETLERRRRRTARRRDLLQQDAEDAEASGGAELLDADADADARADSGVEFVTGEDVGAITSNWFDSFPAALPQSVRDRLLAQLEEFVLDPQISVSLEIALALVGVVEPGQGIVSAEAADETTFTYEMVLHGYDAAVDVAADVERAKAVAGSASAGVAVSELILDASEVIDAVTDIVDEANAQVAADLARTEADGDARVAAQGDVAGDAVNATKPKIVAARTRAEPFMNLATASGRTSMGKYPNRAAASEPISVGAQGAREAAAPGTYDYFGGTDYDYEPFGAVSGTYAVAVSLIFLEQISLNGGSITII